MSFSKAKYGYLLADPEVRRWYRNIARGSKVAADNCLRRLGLFCVDFGLTPRQLAELGDKAVTNFLLDAVDKLQQRGFSGSYINSYMKALKSWLRFNRVNVTVKIKIDGAYDTNTLADERPPTQEELGKIFRANFSL